MTTTISVHPCPPIRDFEYESWTSLVGTSDGSKFITEMWVNSDEFGMGVSYHLLSLDREEHESSSGLCVEKGGVDNMTQGLCHSISSKMI
eukprot:1145633-Pelagomonas_calceolata.AAC.1